MEVEFVPHADAAMPAPLPDTFDGTADGAARPGGVSSGLKRLATHLCRVPSRLDPRGPPRRRGRAGEAAAAPMQPPRRMPHWQRERPKPTPAWVKRGTQASSAYPEGYRPRPRRGGQRRVESRSISPYQSRSRTNSEVRRELLEARRKIDQGRTVGTRVVNREDMPAQYRHTAPY